MTENSSKRHLLCYIIENDAKQRAEIEAQLAIALSDLFSVHCEVFDTIEECREHLHTTEEHPSLVTADLYAAEDKREERVYSVLLAERIPLLCRLREDLGPSVALVVLSRYEQFFEDKHKRERISRALIAATPDGSISKFDSDWPEAIRRIVLTRYSSEAGKNE